MEDFFKDKLSGYSEQPPAGVWDAIDKRRTPLYIWWNAFKLKNWKYAAAILILFSAGFAFWPLNNLHHHSGAVNQETIDKTINPQVNSELLSNPKTAELQSVQKVTDLGTETILKQQAKHKTNKGNTAISQIIEHVVNPNTTGPENKPQEILPQIGKNQTPESDLIANSDNTENDDIANNKSEKEVIHLESEKEKSDELVSNEMSKKPQIIEPKNGKHKNNPFYVMLSAGPMWSGRTLSGESEVKMLRDESEKILAGYNVNARIGYQMGNNWEFESGLQWLNRREKVDYYASFYIQTPQYNTRNVTVYHPLLPPQVIKVTDTSFTTVNEQVNVNRVNNYNYLTIPLVARYSYYNNKWAVFAAGGLLTDIRSGGNAVVMSGQRQTSSLSDYNKPAFMVQRLQLSTGLKYRFNQRFNLIAEPTAVFGLNNVLKNEYGIKQREFNYMINTGLQYQF